MIFQQIFPSRHEPIELRRIYRLDQSLTCSEVPVKRTDPNFCSPSNVLKRDSVVLLGKLFARYLNDPLPVSGSIGT